MSPFYWENWYNYPAVITFVFETFPLQQIAVILLFLPFRFTANLEGCGNHPTLVKILIFQEPPYICITSCVCDSALEVMYIVQLSLCPSGDKCTDLWVQHTEKKNKRTEIFTMMEIVLGSVSWLSQRSNCNSIWWDLNLGFANSSVSGMYLLAWQGNMRKI